MQVDIATKKLIVFKPHFRQWLLWLAPCRWCKPADPLKPRCCTRPAALGCAYRWCKPAAPLKLQLLDAPADEIAGLPMV